LPVLIVLSTSIIIHYRVLYGKLESNSVEDRKLRLVWRFSMVMGRSRQKLDMRAIVHNRTDRIS